MRDEPKRLNEASDLRTSAARLLDLAADSSHDVRVTAMTNPALPISDLAHLTSSDDPGIAESALDAVIGRGSEFQYLVWEEPAVMTRVALRLIETIDERYVVSATRFEAFLRGWNSELAAATDFETTDRLAILDRYLPIG